MKTAGLWVAPEAKTEVSTVTGADAPLPTLVTWKWIGKWLVNCEVLFL